MSPVSIFFLEVWIICEFSILQIIFLTPGIGSGLLFFQFPGFFLGRSVVGEETLDCTGLLIESFISKTLNSEPSKLFSRFKLPSLYESISSI